VVASRKKTDLLALRSGFGGALVGEPSIVSGEGYVCDWRTPIGALRLTVTFPQAASATIRCTTALLPARNVRLSTALRDLLGPENAFGEVHTTQRGLRTGIFFASYEKPSAFSALYLQNFSALTEFFNITQGSPAGTVGGTLFEAGYLPPFGADCVLPSSREIVLSDAYLAVTAEGSGDRTVAGLYLDLLADVYLALERPAVAYHDWPGRAQRTIRDLSLSPACTYERADRRYLQPYVGDTTKPPESMVQLTVLVNTLEYEAWRGTPSVVSAMLRDGIDRFYDPNVGSVVRWLPGEEFGGQSEEHMNDECMDSWYLYHSLFNLSRLATLGDATARKMFRNSLPFAIRVARRFDYRWPIFFSLKTLDIVRAESAPGKGGENDVAGLYALLMLHAGELFGGSEYLEEAKRAAETLRGLGFGLGYQMNTTGFAAEGMLRLWQLTKDRSYLELSELCMANIFDNMWMWEDKVGRANHYRTFFGLFPLHDAPYLAAYEELEAQAKFHEYLALAGRDARPSLRLLLAEYQKYSLDRGWYYYPDALPVDGVAEKSRNGAIERTLSIPLEDLQEGRKLSGEVGQEVYGSGLAFVYSSRHYAQLAASNALLYCSYPIYDSLVVVRGASEVFTFRTGGDRRGECELRVIPIDSDAAVSKASARTVARARSGAIGPTFTVEGHTAFGLEGDTQYEVRLTRTKRRPSERRQVA
jgi:hypothetical protein